MEITQQFSWLKPSEVFYILKNYTEISYTFLNEYKALPKSGNIFFIKKSDFKRWKQDGHNYISRKNGVGTREDREKYTIGNEIVQCTYVHGSGVCPSCKNSYLVTCSNCNLDVTSVLFHRRAYWLLSNPDIILVHYLEESLNKPLDSPNSDEQVKKISSLLRQIDFDLTTAYQIIEFCPDWSDVHGGTKVLICIDSPLMVPNPQNLFCAFGSLLVQVDLVMLGVFKCLTPAHSAGFVDLYLVYESKEITQNRKVFEYKDLGKLTLASNKVEWWENDRKTIEKNFIEDLEKELDEEFEEEVFDEGFFLTKFERVLTGKWERVLDSGKGFLHYLCALGFSQVIKRIADSIKDPGIKDCCQKTPVDIALIKQNYDCAYELIKISCENTAGIRLENIENLKGRVQKIQSHVRAWLQHKQFKNLKTAARVFQKTFRGMIARRNFKYQKQAAIVIQKSVRKWLISLEH